MQRKFKVTILLVLTTAVFAAIAAVNAHAAAQVEVFRTSGNSVMASFHSLDASGCVITDASVFASDGTALIPPGGPAPFQGAGIAISQFDQCRQLLLLTGLGSTDAVNFQIAKDLTSATLSGTIPMDEFVSGTTIQISVNVTWVGNGTTVHQAATSHEAVPGFVEDGHGNGDMQDGQAAGVITDGTQNFAPGASVSAELQQNSSGTISVQAGR
jgi:hypothetical protein